MEEEKNMCDLKERSRMRIGNVFKDKDNLMCRWRHANKGIYEVGVVNAIERSFWRLKKVQEFLCAANMKSFRRSVFP
jgi:hypothetical protein